MESKATILANAVPVLPRLCGIYFLIAKGQIVYVGQSVDIHRRMAGHRDKDGVIGGMLEKKFDRYAWILAPEHDLGRIERAYIQAFRPKYNLSQNPAVPKRTLRIGARRRRTSAQIRLDALESIAATTVRHGGA